MTSKLLQEYNRLIQASRVYELVKETPMQPMERLSKRLNQHIYLKREDMHPVFSFKIRGAYNLISSLSQQKKEAGVITVSAGNHAQGVALAAQKLAIKATIVMPRTTPDTKVNAVRSYQASVILKGDTFDEAYSYTKELIRKHGYTYIPPFDHREVIAGQGTIGAEIIRQQQEQLDAIFVCVGGGGLIAGIGAYIKYIKPHIKIIGVEPEDAACMSEALKQKRRIRLGHVGIFADGAAVNQVGRETFKLASQCVDQMIKVSTDEICAAIKDIFEDTRVLAEPAGALAIAGLHKYCAKQHTQQHLVAVLSGANTNFDRLRHIAERTEIGEQREALFAVTIPEKRGSFRRFCQLLHKYEITEFNYRFCHQTNAQIFVGLRIATKENRQEIARLLKENGYAAIDLTDNEMAKVHIRYMVGGAPPNPLKDEVIYRFEFPERPGALLNFLNKLSPRWNISLFHYRNHGAAYGRVLAGMQVPPAETKDLHRYFKEINYFFQEEKNNPAYRLFLRSPNH